MRYNAKPHLIYFIWLIIFNSSSSAQLITTIAGNGINGAPLGDGGLAINANLGIFAGLAFDTSGNLYLTDGNKNRLRKIDAVTGIITTVAGNGTAGYGGDNGPANAAIFDAISWVAIDRHNNIYVTDGGNDRIRKINAVTGIITTVAGNGTPGFSGDNNQAITAQLYTPHGIAVDTADNLYIVDNSNHRIRKVDANGIITTFAGNGNTGVGADGVLATQTELDGIYGLCVDALGNVYVAEQDNNRVRKINVSTGIITTVAGTGDPGFGGDNGLAINAKLHWPFGINMDRAGNLYIADQVNNRIRKVDAVGMIYSVAGNGLTGFSGDSGLADMAKLNRPEGVAIDSCNNLFLVDSQNKRIRKVTFNPNCSLVDTTDTTNAVHVIAKGKNNISIYPNPATDEIKITGADKSDINIINTVGQVLIEQKQYAGQASVNVSALNTGVYYVVLRDRVTGEKVTRRFVKE